MKKGKSQEVIAEELIDVIFYVLGKSRLACPYQHGPDVPKETREEQKESIPVR